MSPREYADNYMMLPVRPRWMENERIDYCDQSLERKHVPFILRLFLSLF